MFIGLVLALVSVYFRLGGRARGLVIGGFSSYVLFAVGWMVLGIAGWRSDKFPAWIGLLFVVAGLLGYNAGMPPYGIPIGLVMATLGWWIIRTGAPAAPVGGATTSGQAARSAGHLADTSR
ncbi:hypothetical protein GU243_17290 [Pseudarthrobacter psychrotolerans]|uniref:Uncharacterized protein n=1 Tax=Pseudarthrobacter psychrotolerans TaxID=2697569 RepID=A0A6P1NWA2_9MICC|nr:hypothetical protein [Pseudarthrobacter psychrotolerans]QHK21171.1 hypothetical protein GU243_17290 [Pseudarthrobacter psychrotolerans]